MIDNTLGPGLARPVRKMRLKLYDKAKALVDLGRHMGMFVDKTEVDHKGVIPVDITDEESRY